MASNLGTLTYDVVAKIGGFVDGLSAAERQAQKSADAINKQIESIGVASYAVGNALGQYLKQGIDFAASVFPNLIKQAADFQDIADKTGGSAEGFAAFAVSAKVAGVSIESIADASAHLSKALLQAGDDTKPVTAGLKALGLNIADFKKLQPDQQIAAVANAFGNFADGANKAAVAQQLFGRSGADLLKFLSDYVQNGGDVRILTGDLIKQSDDYSDALTRQRAILGLTASALAGETLGAITAFSGAMKDAIIQAAGLDDVASKLGANTAVRYFAEDAGRALAGAVDYVKQSVREFQVLVDFVTESAKAVKQVGDFDFAGAARTGADFRAKYGLDEFGRKVGGDSGTAAGKSFVDAFNAQLAGAKRSAFAQTDPRRVDLGPDGKPKDSRPDLPATAPKKAGSGADPDSLIKAQLNAQLDSIKNFGKAQQDAAANSTKILEAMHSAGLTSDQDYYAQRKQLLAQDTQAQVDSLNAQIAALQSVSFTGKNAAKDQVDNQKKITDAQAQLTKVQADAAAQAQVLGIQEESAYRKMAVALIAARQAAQDFFDTTNKGYANTLAGVGQGDKQRDFLNNINAINDRYEQQRQTLQNSRVQATAAAGGKLDPAVAKQFDDQLAIINEFQGKAVKSYKDFYGQLDAAQQNWLNGAQDALKNYSDAAANTAELTKGVFDDAFKGLEDTLTDFFSTGKADWKSFANSVIADIDRMIVKQLILGPLAKQISGFLGGSGSGGIGDSISGFLSSGGLLGKFFGGSAGGAVSGGFSGLSADTLALGGFAGGGFTGWGAANDPAGIVHKGEVVWSQGDVAAAGGVSAVEALRRGGGGGGGLTVNFAVQGPIDRRTQSQVANQLRRSTLTAGVRLGS